MSNRLISTATNSNLSRVAKVYRNAEWDEWIVKFILNGIRQEDADYHTNDKQDALSTAQHWTEQ